MRALLFAIACLVVSCSKPSDAPLVGASSPALLVPNWYVDPANASGCASDANNGQSATCGASGVGPLLDLATIVARWGTRTPLLSISVTITLLSDDTLADPWAVTPTVLGSGLSLTLVGAPSVTATTTLGTYVAANYAAGTKPTITASGQSGAYWTPFVNAIVHDTTEGASFIIDSDQGAAVATISTPFALPVGILPTKPSSPPAPGDVLQIVHMPVVYVASLEMGNAPITQRLIELTVEAPTPDLIVGLTSLLTEDVVQVFDFSARSLSGFTSIAGACSFGSTVMGGGSLLYYGGVMQHAGNIFSENAQLDGDVYVNQRIHWTTGNIVLRQVYFGQTDDDDIYGVNNFEIVQSNGGGPARVWGPGGFNVIAGNTLIFDRTITATAALLLTGPIEVDGATTAFPWLPGSNAYGTPVTITAAAIDASGGLSNPATGSRIFRR